MAYGHPQQGDAQEAARLRKEAGRYLKKLREDAEVTQNGLAQAIGIEYYTMVSQVENGRSRVPPDKLIPWAKAINVSPKELAKRLLRYYDPFMWQALFGDGKDK